MAEAESSEIIDLLNTFIDSSAARMRNAQPSNGGIQITLIGEHSVAPIREWTSELQLHNTT
jgi:hypothetical protein